MAPNPEPGIQTPKSMDSSTYLVEPRDSTSTTSTVQHKYMLVISRFFNRDCIFITLSYPLLERSGAKVMGSSSITPIRHHRNLRPKQPSSLSQTPHIHPWSLFPAMLCIPHATTTGLQNPTAPPPPLPRILIDTKGVHWTKHTGLVIVKDLVRILQNSVDHLALEARIADVAMGATPHERGPEHDGQVLASHPVCSRVLHDPEQVQRDSTKRCIVGVWQGVDDGMK